MVGRAYGVPTVALRFFNAYGPFQSLSNPYTGVLAIFASRLMNGQRPIIFEDGQQLRDFVSVSDVAQACRLAIEVEAAQDLVFNVGSGQTISGERGREESSPKCWARTSSLRLAANIAWAISAIAFPDISLAQKVLGYKPRITLENGMRELAEWLEQQTAHDRFNEMRDELASRGLVV